MSRISTGWLGIRRRELSPPALTSVYVYGEPAGQTVRDNWGRSSKLWHLMLAQRGYVIVSLVDTL
jgi:hypothetical protein